MLPNTHRHHILRKAYSSYLSKLFFYAGLFLFLASSQIILTTSLAAHELPRLHEHLPENRFRYSPREIEIELIAPAKLGQAMQVRIGFQSIDDEPIILTAKNSWAGVASDMRFEDIRATTFSGQALYLEKLGSRQWKVQSPREHWVNVYYSIPPNRNEASGQDHFKPILNSDFFHAIGQLFLVLPEDRQTDLVKVRIKWSGFEKHGWRTLQAAAYHDEEVLSKSALLSSLFMAGNLHVHESLTPYGNVRIAMQKTDWNFSTDAFTDLAKQIIQNEREYFSVSKNPDAMPFLVSLVQIAPGFDGVSINGTSLHNSFALFVSPKTKLYESDFGNPTTTVAFLLAHEMMHQWIGHELKTSEEPEALGYWFTEGFTDYFTLQLLYQAKLINLDGYVDLFNHMLEEYWLSSKRNVSNHEIARDFWNNTDTNRMPYLRGFLIAAKVDQEMRQQKNTRLKNMMQKMLAHSDGQAHHTAISNQSLLWNIQNQIGKPITDGLRRSVENGENVGLSTSLFSPCLEIGTRELGNYDPGFNVDATMQTMRLTGVRRNSRAYQVGLRNGQSLAELDIGDNPKEKILVAIFENDNHRRIKSFEYLPVGNPRPVMQAKINNATSCSGIL